MTRSEGIAIPAGRGIRGPVLIATAAILWSTSGFFAKAPLFVDWPVEIRGPLLAFWRSFFAGLALLPFVRRPRWTPKLVPMVLVFAAMNVTYLTAMALTTAANAIWLQSTAPVWVFLVGVFWFGERVNPGDRLMLCFGVAGVGLILVFEAHGDQLAGIVYGLLAGVFYAAVVLSIRRLRNEGAVWLIALNHAVTAAILAPYVAYQAIWPSGRQWLFLSGFGVIQIGIPYVLFARGLRSVSGHEASGIVLLEPVLVPVWVYLAWHNTASYAAPSEWTLLGGGLILAGLVLRYCKSRRAAADDSGRPG